MAVEPGRWLGRCVRLEGYVSFNRFYADVAGYYSYDAANHDDRQNDGWLGLYPRRRYGFRGPMRRGSVVGIVHDCETDRDRAEAASPDSIIMMRGFCHYRYGLVLRVAAYRGREQAAFTRQRGDAARLTFGDLRTESEIGPVPPEVRAIVSRFAAAVRAQDEQALNAFVMFQFDNDGPDAPNAVNERRSFLLGEGASPLAALRARSRPAQAVFVRERMSVRVAESGHQGGWHACFCRRVDCTGLWPISAIDASADPVRPYFCVRPFNYDYRLPPNQIAIVRQSSYPIEPESAAFRRQRDSSRR